MIEWKSIVSGKCVEDHNVRSYSDADLAQCQDFCEKESKCKSIDLESDKTCYLNTVNSDSDSYVDEDCDPFDQYSEWEYL